MRISRRLAASAGVAITALISAPSVHAAAVIIVTTTAPGIAADGFCSLAEAIQNANASAAIHADCAAGSNPTTIELNPAAIYTLDAPFSPLDDGTGLPQVTATIIVNGHGAIIERSSAGGTPPFRLMAVMPTGILTLNEVTLRGGLANSDGSGLGGGALLNAGTATLVNSLVDGNRSGTNGGGLSNFASLTVRDSRVQNNVAVSAGGGLRNDIGTLTVEQSVVTANRSTGEAGRGGGIANHASAGNATLIVIGGEITDNLTEGIGGAGLDNAASGGRIATAALTGAVIRGNVASGPDHTRGLGGGIQNSFFRGVVTAVASVTVDRSVITANSAVNGGGISSGFDLGGSNELRLTVTRSEISGNSATGTGFQVGNGGGIYGLGGTTVVANSTISGNEALGTGHPISGLGGGLMNAALNGKTGDMTVLNATIVGNAAATLGGGVLATPFNGFANTSIGSSIVAFNTSPAGAGCGVIASLITSLGSNVESGNTCSFVQPSDKANTNPLIGPLAANGGTTRTHALLPGSPAIDAGDPVVCAAPPVGAVDQRGNGRPTGLGCDAGAYESAWAASVLTLNTTFSLSDGTKETGRFVLLADGTMVDESGGTGFWWLPQPGVLAIVTDDVPRILWVGIFTSPTTVSGRVFGLDGSTLTGVWSGTRVN